MAPKRKAQAAGDSPAKSRKLAGRKAAASTAVEEPALEQESDAEDDRAAAQAEEHRIPEPFSWSPEQRTAWILARLDNSPISALEVVNSRQVRPRVQLLGGLSLAWAAGLTPAAHPVFHRIWPPHQSR